MLMVKEKQMIQKKTKNFNFNIKLNIILNINKIY